jgi:hypothetical protein
MTITAACRQDAEASVRAMYQGHVQIHLVNRLS